MPERAKLCGEHSERIFLPTRRKFVLPGIRTCDLVGATLMSRAKKYKNLNVLITSQMDLIYSLAYIPAMSITT